MRKPVVLITGASGEIGHGLIQHLAGEGRNSVITVDLRPLEGDLQAMVEREFIGSILDQNLLERIVSEYEVDMIFHLAALLSTRSEFTPVTAHQVNVEGTLNLLHFAQSEGESHGRPDRVPVPELDRCLRPARPRVQGACRPGPRARVDHPDHHVRLQQALLRAPRPLLQPLTTSSSPPRPCPARSTSGRSASPALISAVTVPSGGTSDYAPEMIHAAAQGKPYACFVRPDTRIPFMAMPDAVDALLRLARVDRDSPVPDRLQHRRLQPVGRRDPELVQERFPDANITFDPDLKRQAIVDSWPEDVDDSAARRDWGLAPAFDLDRAFHEYLFPTIRARYRAELASLAVGVRG